MIASKTTPEIGSASWETWGVQIVLRVTDARLLVRAQPILECQLDEIDRACSRFRPDSDLARVNASAGRVVQIDPVLVDALQIALQTAALTDGAVDLTVGAALVLAGYDRDWSSMIEHGNTVRLAGPNPWPPRPTVLARTLTGWRAVELDSNRGLVRIPAGMRLDLGATAKAWAADRAARVLAETLGCGVLVSLGGDISCAGAAPEGGWLVHVADDHRAGPDAPGQTIALTAGGLASSSVAVRRWSRDGVAMHHIIDPASGAPVRGRWRTVSVAAANCVDANTAATASIVRDSSAVDWLIQQRLPARLVSHEGAVRLLGGWPQPSTTPSRAATPSRLSA